MNKIILHGRLTRDPELKTGASGVEFCKFTVAVDRKLNKDKMMDKKADFFDCTAFGKTGVAINAFMKKGREILVDGRMESSTVDKDGQKRTFWGVTVDSFYFCGPKQDGQASAEATADPAGFTPVETDELPF